METGVDPALLVSNIEFEFPLFIAGGGRMKLQNPDKITATSTIAVNIFP